MRAGLRAALVVAAASAAFAPVALALAALSPAKTPAPAGAPAPGAAAGGGRAPYASDRPVVTPRLFAEGSISTGDYESHPAFSPDGFTLYFLKNTPDFRFWTIVLSRWERGGWSAPEVAPFSGRYSDADPFITADGSRMFFISTRAPTGGVKDDLDIWMMERTATGWSAPVNPGPPVNSEGNEWYPTLSSDGTIYFGSDRPGGAGATDLYRCRFENGRWLAAENLGDAINTDADEYEPFIAPDQSYLIFMASRPGGLGKSDLWMSRNVEGQWSAAVNPGEPINSPASELSPKISPDGRSFFFTSTRGFGGGPLPKRAAYDELTRRLRSAGNGLGDIYQVDANVLLDTRP